VKEAAVVGVATGRLAIDIGGTFTDVVLEHGGTRAEAKVLTTPGEPEQGVIEAVRLVLGSVRPRDIGVVIHGTTLATNAIIERKGARVALITTEGFRDSIEMAQENRFDQYDVFMERPDPLVPRYLRFGVPERTDARGQVRTKLDTARVAALAETLRLERIESVAIGFLHSYANPAHEIEARTVLAEALPGVTITLSSEVCPEVREYERFSTACANAYVQPRMARYLSALRQRLDAFGLACPLLLMTSGGGLTTLETAIRFPIRLVESGPAGGAILAATIARQKGIDAVLSFDMGGTTAKICLIDGGEPQAAREFEVDRRTRFLKGSGLPVRVPVVEMVEIGAGGGSIATLDPLRRIAVGPESAGADPGPACYGLGGTAPTVTDADLILGRIDPDGFAGGRIRLLPDRAQAALQRDVGAALGLDAMTAAFGVSEMVEEAMANAARVHAVERGKDLAGRTLIAFGGGAPLHAARLAEKLGIGTVLIPRGAGVGSAIGFLRAPVAFEVVRSRFMRVSGFDATLANDLFAEMEAEATGAVRLGAPDADVVQVRTAEMRYAGQGHEIVVALPIRRFVADDARLFRGAFEAAYEALFGRTIPKLDMEIVSWTLRATAVGTAEHQAARSTAAAFRPAPSGARSVYDRVLGMLSDVPVYHRADLAQGARIDGPAVITEDATTTIVGTDFTASIDADGAIRLRREIAS
jgi:N-methylhydantoinase A